MKRSCELCEGTARIHCAPDHASLCWDCDAVVHSANFLVARHSRNMLCHVCQSPTPWYASGSTLGATVSVCQQCEVDEEAVEEMEDQAVPWSPPPPPPESSDDDEHDPCSIRGLGPGWILETRWN